jgi:hypothetical protein
MRTYVSFGSHYEKVFERRSFVGHPITHARARTHTHIVCIKKHPNTINFVTLTLVQQVHLNLTLKREKTNRLLHHFSRGRFPLSMERVVYDVCACCRKIDGALNHVYLNFIEFEEVDDKTDKSLLIFLSSSPNCNYLATFSVD